MVPSPRMQQDARFFQSTRGRIVTALRRRHAATAADLAAECNVSANAVRQQLVFLERDGFVSERATRRGRTKPTLEYSLTPAAESLFPQRYDRVLNAVLREVRETGGSAAVSEIFERIGRRATQRHQQRLEGKDVKGRVLELSEILRENSVETDVVETANGLELREHNCPYAKTVTEHPEVCRVIHTVLHEMLPSDPVQVESLASGGSACRFEIDQPSGAVS